MKALVGTFNQDKALVGAFSVITNRRMELFQALVIYVTPAAQHLQLRTLSRLHARRAEQIEPGRGTRAQLSSQAHIVLHSLCRYSILNIHESVDEDGIISKAFHGQNRHL